MGRPFFLFAAVVCASCLDPTQITVTIGTEYDCAMYKTNAALWIGDESGSTGSLEAFTAQKSCTSGQLVGDIVVVPRRSPDDTVWVRVVAGLNGTDPKVCSQPEDPDAGPPPPTVQCIEAKRILRFVRHSKLAVSITLDSACINKRCMKKTETCQKGVCVDANVSPEDAGNPILDSGPVIDTGPVFKAATHLYGSFDDVCATAADGLYCFGSNTSGQLGPNAMGLQAGPTKIPLNKSLTSIAVGAGHICVTDGTQVYCWGAGARGELGRPLMANKDANPAPVSVAFTSSITNVVSGDGFSCAQSKQPWCWGTMFATVADYGPTPKNLGFDVNAIVAGAHHACIILPTLAVACWGDNQFAQFGVDPSSPKSSATPISNKVAGVMWVAAGFSHSAANDDSMNPQQCFGGCNVGWGSNMALELGGSVPSLIWPPKRLGIGATQLVFGENHMCMLDAMGSIRCRGKNDEGQVGFGPIDSGTGFLTVPITATTIVAGRAFTCALDTGKHVWCWGTIPGVMMNQKMPVEVLLP